MGLPVGCSWVRFGEGGGILIDRFKVKIGFDWGRLVHFTGAKGWKGQSDSRGRSHRRDRDREHGLLTDVSVGRGV